MRPRRRRILGMKRRTQIGDSLNACWAVLYPLRVQLCRHAGLNMTQQSNANTLIFGEMQRTVADDRPHSQNSVIALICTSADRTMCGHIHDFRIPDVKCCIVGFLCVVKSLKSAGRRR